MASKKQQIKQKIREERIAKRNAERFERTEGDAVYQYNSFHAHHYCIFNAEMRDKGCDHSFGAYYRSLPPFQQRFIHVKPLIPGLAAIRLKLKNEEFQSRVVNNRK